MGLNTGTLSAAHDIESVADSPVRAVHKYNAEVEGTTGCVVGSEPVIYKIESDVRKRRVT